MAEDRLLSTLIAPESTKNEDHDADATSINTTIREIRKENRDEDRIPRDLDFIFNPEKDNYEPKKTVSAFNDNYIQCGSIGNKDKTLLPKDYLEVIRPYLNHMINNTGLRFKTFLQR